MTRFVVVVADAEKFRNLLHNYRILNGGESAVVAEEVEIAAKPKEKNAGT